MNTSNKLLTPNKNLSDKPASLSQVKVTRRHTLQLLGALSVLGGGLSACGDSSDSENTSVISNDSTGSSDDNRNNQTGSCVLIPSETEGPYPLTAILSNSAIVRQDITEGKTGVPLTLKLNIVDINNSCSAFTYASVYIWHCDKDGVYSGYSQPGANAIGETFCRGVGDTDENGEVTFTTIYPGWYTGRITHIHFQVFLYNDTSAMATVTSQIAFPEAVTTAVYNSSFYSAHGQNNSVNGFASDNIFSDGVDYQMAKISGSVDEGYVASLQVGISA